MKQIAFLLMVMLLPTGMIAQVDDLYFVPKKKAQKEIKVTNGGGVKVVSKSATPTTVNNNVNSIDEDAYNRRNVSVVQDESYEQSVEEEESYEYSDNYSDEVDADYTYSSRIVRFHSPRRAVVLSSPLYWDVVYNSGLDN